MKIFQYKDNTFYPDSIILLEVEAETIKQADAWFKELQGEDIRKIFLTSCVINSEFEATMFPEGIDVETHLSQMC